MRFRVATCLAVIMALALGFSFGSGVASKDYTVLTMDAYLGGGEVIAPHLYDWYFNGVDDYISTASMTVPSEFTYTVFFTPVVNSTSRWGWGVFRWDHRILYGRMDVGDPRLILSEVLCNDGSARALISLVSAQLGVLTAVSLSYSNNIAYIYVNSVFRNWRDLSAFGGARVISAPAELGRRTAGADHYAGYVSVAIAHATRLTDSSIGVLHSNYIVNASGLRLFLDATAFNGTHYIDLSGNNHGVPYNGVSRVRSNSTWLWLVRGMYSDNRIRFRFVPHGWYIAVINMDNLWSTVIDTSVYRANQAGMVE